MDEWEGGGVNQISHYSMSFPRIYDGVWDTVEEIILL